MRNSTFAWMSLARAITLLATAAVTLWAATAAAGGAVPTATFAIFEPTATTDVAPTREDPPRDEPTPTPGEGSGGIVVPSPTPTEEHGSIAPGFVTVVVWTSDGGPLPDGAIVCVGDLCQDASGRASGAKVAFDRVNAGWHDVLARGGGIYGDASSSVQVVQGQGSRLELTIVLAQPQATEPPTERASGPIRQPIQVSSTESAREWDVASETDAADSAAPTDVVVTSLPVAGAGQAGGGAQTAYLAIGVVLLLGAGALAVRKAGHAA